MGTALDVERIMQALRHYDQGIWPLPMLATMLGLVVLLLALHRLRPAGRFICSLLALSWVWIGVEYHGVALGGLQPHGDLLGTLFVLQGLLLFWHGVLMGRLSFHPQAGAPGLAGGAFLVYSLAVYPLLCELLGQGALTGQSLGVAPGPTAIFTLGLFLWTEEGPPLDLLVIPVLWAVLGTQTAWDLGQWPDLVLPAVAALSLGLVLRRRWRRRHGRGPAQLWQTGA
jgi:hypothetical protein